MTEEEIYADFAGRGVSIERHEHAAVFTVEESAALHHALPASHTKNLFLADKKGHFWLITLPHDRRADLKALAELLGAGKFSFGKPEDMERLLGVTPGAVTPLRRPTRLQRRSAWYSTRASYPTGSQFIHCATPRPWPFLCCPGRLARRQRPCGAGRCTSMDASWWGTCGRIEGLRLEVRDVVTDVLTGVYSEETRRPQALRISVAVDLATPTLTFFAVHAPVSLQGLHGPENRDRRTAQGYPFRSDRSCRKPYLRCAIRTGSQGPACRGGNR